MTGECEFVISGQSSHWFPESARFSMRSLAKTSCHQTVCALSNLKCLLFYALAALPTTTWPCRLLHVTGQVEPILTINPKYFQSRVRDLRVLKYGAMMKNYKTPEDRNRYDALSRGAPDGAIAAQTPNSTWEADQKKEIYRKWLDLHKKTKSNLLRLEDPNFILPNEARGMKDVIDLVSVIQVSD